MSRSELSAAVQRVITRHSVFHPARLDDDAVLSRELGYDSVGFFATLADLEAEFRFEFPPDRIDELKTITLAGLVHLVADRSPAVS